MLAASYFLQTWTGIGWVRKRWKNRELRAEPHEIAEPNVANYTGACGAQNTESPEPWKPTNSRNPSVSSEEYVLVNYPVEDSVDRDSIVESVGRPDRPSQRSQSCSELHASAHSDTEEIPKSTVKESPTTFTQVSMNSSARRVLGDLRQTNEDMQQLTMELNGIRKLFMSELNSFMQLLVELLKETEDASPTLNLPKLLKEKLDNLSSKQLQDLRIQEDMYTDKETEIVNKLFSSLRWQDKIFEREPSAWSDIAPRRVTMSTPTPSATGDPGAEQPPQLARYLSKLGDVAEFRDQIRDLRSDRAQLLAEQESRREYGLSLDEDSLYFLETYQSQHDALVESFESAQRELEVLQATLGDGDTDAELSADYRKEIEDEDSVQSQLPVPDSAIVTGLYRLLDRHPPESSIESLLQGNSNAPIDTADFINAWLLMRLLRSPHQMVRFAVSISAENLHNELESVGKLILQTWFNDGSKALCETARLAVDQQSMITNIPDSHHMPVDTSLPAPSNAGSLPLLQMGPDTTTERLIEQAVRTRQQQESNEPKRS